jgi:hypothetical protein
MRFNHFLKPASQKQNEQGIITASKFTWENSAKELLNGLKL